MYAGYEHTAPFLPEYSRPTTHGDDTALPESKNVGELLLETHQMCSEVQEEKCGLARRGYLHVGVAGLNRRLECMVTQRA